MFAKILVTECLNKIIFGRNSSTSEAKKNVCHSFTGCLKFLDLQDNSGGEEAINVSGLNYVAKLDKERSGFFHTQVSANSWSLIYGLEINSVYVAHKLLAIKH